MSVQPSELQNPERDLNLTDRDPKGTQKVQADLQRVKNKTPTADEQLHALQERIALARTIQPSDEERHCLDCFEKGRNAAIRAIMGD